MRIKRLIPICISAVVAALIFVSCKPTEKNYKAAYDAAKAKREQAAAEQMRPATGLMTDDGPKLRVIAGDTLFMSQERLRMPDGSRVPGHWAVAVALFKMNTNARASAEALRDKGYDRAVAVNAPEGRHYALATTVSTLDSAKMAVGEFRTANPDYPYIGLPGAPVIINY